MPDSFMNDKTLSCEWQTCSGHQSLQVWPLTYSAISPKRSENSTKVAALFSEASATRELVLKWLATDCRFLLDVALVRDSVSAESRSWYVPTSGPIRCVIHLALDVR